MSRKVCLMRIGWLCLTTILLSCQQDSVYDPGEADKLTELAIPQNFDWELTEDLSFSVTSEIPTSVSVYADAACQDLLATLPATEMAKAVNLSVPKGTVALYIQYPTTKGGKAILTAGITETKKGGSITQVNVKLPENGVGEEDEHDHVIYYPARSKGWGTVFFEDMWPQMGDYDFNDVAVWYKIQVNLRGAIIVAVRLNGLGGLMPYQLGLQIDNLKVSEMDEVTPYGNVGDGKYLLETEGEQLAVFIYDWPGKKGSYGGSYYNTEKAYQVDQDDLESNQVAFVISLSEEKIRKINLQSFNFFLRKKDGTEIHLKGYEPTQAFKETYQQIVAESDNLDPNNYYSTRDGFVWGIKIPLGIDHAAEKVDFMKAYKFFREWVTTGGERKKNWYKEEAGKEFRIEVGKRK